MRLRTILLIGLGVFVVAIVAAVVVLSSMDFGKYKGLIVERAEQATGRKLTIAGDLKLSVFPVPALNVKDVRFANADWGSRPELAKLGELSARVALLPLIFGGNLHIARLALKDVDVLLETDGKGHGNWEFGALASTKPKKPTEAAPKGAGAFELPSFDRILLQNILVTYRDGQTRKTTTATLTELSTSGSFGGPMQVKAVAPPSCRASMPGRCRAMPRMHKRSKSASMPPQWPRSPGGSSTAIETYTQPSWLMR